MIQPARARTPGRDLEDPDGMLSPATPRKGLKPKLSSYFNQQFNTAAPSKTDLTFGEDLLSPRWPSWSADDVVPSPNTESLIDAVMCRLLAEPYTCLDPRFNGLLMQIFESYRDLVDQKQQLLANARQEVERRGQIDSKWRLSAQQWDREKQQYKAEVKRLELILAKGKRGLAEVTLTRQDSVLQQKQRETSEHSEDETMETIFEFLEKTKRYEDKAWSSQRGESPRRKLKTRRY